MINRIYQSVGGSTSVAFLNDGWACVSLDGIEVFQKRNHQGEEDEVGLYALEISYRSGSTVLVEYGPDLSSRDSMFFAIVDELGTTS